MLTYMVALSTRSSARRTTKVNFDNWIGFYMTRNTYTSTTLYRYTSCSTAGMARPPISRVSSKSHASAQKRCRYLYNTLTRYTQKQQPWASVQETGVPEIFFFSFQIVSCVIMCCCLCLDWMAKLTRREMANILRVSYLYIYIYVQYIQGTADSRYYQGNKENSLANTYTELCRYKKYYRQLLDEKKEKKTAGLLMGICWLILVTPVKVYRGQ